MTQSKTPRRKGFLSTLVYLWLSLTLHLYLLYAVILFPSVSDFLSQLAAAKEDKPTQIRNIILQTADEALPPEEEAAISDKNAADASPIFDLSKPRAYNFAGKSPAALIGENPDTQEKTSAERGRIKAEAVQAGGQQAPFLFDPEKEPVVNLYNSGNMSLAAEAKDYAVYFLEMQKKIAKYHREFFPVYQYYQGLIRDGVVVVDFVVDKKGNVAKAEIVTSYGSDSVDAASLNSIIYAKNFGPLPADLAKQGFVKIRFHFVYFSK